MLAALQSRNSNRPQRSITITQGAARQLIHQHKDRDEKEVKQIAKTAVFAIATAMTACAIAATPKYDRMAAEGDQYILNWKERNGEIVYDTVCQANKKGSIQYRNCRRRAQLLFRDKCNQSDDKSGKWCTAKYRYFP